MQNSLNIAYIFSAILFIFGIKMLGKQQTARKGNIISGIAMLVAVSATLLHSQILSYSLIIFAIVIGTIIGIPIAYRTPMIKMPEMVALLNGFGGLASLLVGLAEFHKLMNIGAASYFATSGIVHSDITVIATMIATFAAVVIGAITFSGSSLAYAKLSGKMKISAFPFIKAFNAIALSIIIALGIAFTISTTNYQESILWAITVASLIFGISIILPIGGGDMPVIISLLNSLSGMAASATGLIVSNLVLVIAGCLVGTSGLILTMIMCKAMNRNLQSVLFSGFGQKKSITDTSDAKPKSISPEDAYYAIEAARNIMFVPGYGMAVAQAQHVVKELSDILEQNGATVTFAIHPVAGRMPGHMNVLLAEADVSYDQLIDMDTANREIPNIDLAIVIGANDVVNPAAAQDASSPLYGMPIINVHQAKSVIILKRGSGTGFSGLENLLFVMPNVSMAYGDAKKTLSSIISSFKED